MWSRALAPDVAVSLAAIAGGVVAAGGAVVRFFDPSGAPVWRAGRDGFDAAEAAGRSDPVFHVRGRPAAVSRGRVLMEFAEPDGHGLYLLDPGTRTVHRVSPPVAVHSPVAVPPDQAGQADHGLLAALGPVEEVDPGRYRWLVLVLDEDGRVRWSHRLPAEPLDLLAAPGDTVVAVCGPSLRRFEDYHSWYDLSTECLVRCIGERGQQLWTWQAPVPLTYRPALGPDGTVYVAAPGRLWALR